MSFLFFCLGNFIFFFRSLLFLIICTQNDDKQQKLQNLIFDGNFKIIDTISIVFIFTFLLVSCFIDYKRINKNFIFFEKKYLSMYIASGLIYFSIFCCDILFTNIIKKNIFNDGNKYKVYAIINFVFVTFFCVLDGVLQRLARKKMFSKKI